VDAISDGLDPVLGPHLDHFSVSPGSAGAPGSGVDSEFVGDTPPGALPGHASDIFIAGLGLAPGVNMVAPAGFGYTLGTGTGDEANAGLINPGDNVSSLELLGASSFVFFSLAPGSPTLAGIGATAADILVKVLAGPPIPPVIALPGAMLGLPPGTDMDALALFAPAGVFGGAGTIEYSLTSATAGLAGVSGADVLGLPVGPPAVAVVHAAPAIGLLPSDDLDALDVGSTAIPEPGSVAFLALVGSLVVALRALRPYLLQLTFAG
jgi:hypothetical protein